MKKSKPYRVLFCFGLTLIAAIFKGWCSPPGPDIAMNRGFEETALVDGSFVSKWWTRTTKVEPLLVGPPAFQGILSANIPGLSRLNLGVSSALIWQDLHTTPGGVYLVQFFCTASDNQPAVLATYLNETLARAAG